MYLFIIPLPLILIFLLLEFQLCLSTIVYGILVIFGQINFCYSLFLVTAF